LENVAAEAGATLIASMMAPTDNNNTMRLINATAFHKGAARCSRPHSRRPSF
jgi:hypothetical protein